MLTIFSTPKSFKGHTDTIQGNALLHPDVEIIMPVYDEGTAEAPRELRIVYVKEVRAR